MKKLTLSVAAMLISGSALASEANVWGGDLDGAYYQPAKAEVITAAPIMTFADVVAFGEDLDGGVPDHGPANMNMASLTHEQIAAVDGAYYGLDGDCELIN